jgi:hypothetical protein
LLTHDVVLVPTGPWVTLHVLAEGRRDLPRSKSSGLTPTMLEAAQHRLSGGLPSGSESKKVYVERQVGGWSRVRAMQVTALQVCCRAVQ